MAVEITTDRSGAEKRRDLYADLEEMLVPGFVSQPLSIAGVQWSIRSLFPGELMCLRHRIGGARSDRVWKEWLVSTATWMVGGQILLEDVNAPVRLHRTIQQLPNAALDALFSLFIAQRNRATNAARRLEAFCYEDTSRSQWRMSGRGTPSREDLSGVFGTSRLGMNGIQRVWTSFNLAEDDRLKWQQEWAAAKLVASATNPKGVRKISQRDESQQKMEEERRQRVMDLMYFEATGHRLSEETGQVTYRSVSPEELVEEMHRWVRGEKDEHDLIVDAFKDQIRSAVENQRKQHQERMAALERIEEEYVGDSVVGYTREQMEELGLGAPKASTRKVIDGSHAGRLYDKFLAGGVQEQFKPAEEDLEESLDEGKLMNDLQGRKVRIEGIS